MPYHISPTIFQTTFQSSFIYNLHHNFSPFILPLDFHPLYTSIASLRGVSSFSIQETQMKYKEHGAKIQVQTSDVLDQKSPTGRRDEILKFPTEHILRASESFREKQARNLRVHPRMPPPPLWKYGLIKGY